MSSWQRCPSRAASLGAALALALTGAAGIRAERVQDGLSGPGPAAWPRSGAGGPAGDGAAPGGPGEPAMRTAMLAVACPGGTPSAP